MGKGISWIESSENDRRKEKSSWKEFKERNVASDKTREIGMRRLEKLPGEEFITKE